MLRYLRCQVITALILLIVLKLASAIEGLQSILTEIHISKSIAEKLYQKVRSLNDAGIPAFGLIPGLLRAMPNRFDELALTMKLGLISEKHDLVVGAMDGLADWLTSPVETAENIKPPPEHLVREIGIIIATHKKEFSQLCPTGCKADFRSWHGGTHEGHSPLCFTRA